MYRIAVCAESARDRRCENCISHQSRVERGLLTNLQMRHPNRYAQVADFDCPGLESSNWRHLTEEETSLASEELNDLFLHARDGPKRVGL